MNRLKSTPSTALSSYIRASLLGLSSLAMFTFPVVGHADLTPTQQDLTKLYLASFLRAPDLGGLNYWNAQLTSGSTLQTVGGTIFSIPIVLEIYPQGMSDRDFVEAIYQNVFGRKSDQGGLDYWMKELADLRTQFELTITDDLNAYLARGQLVVNMINAGLGTVDGTEGKAYIVNRLNVAKAAMERQLITGLEIPPAELKDIENCADENATSTDFALGEIASFYEPAHTLGGAVSGLAAGQTLVLKYNCGTTHQVINNGSFTFGKRLANAVNYAVSVAQQPNGQVCSVTNDRGVVNGGNVSNVQVFCQNLTGAITHPSISAGFVNIANLRSPLGTNLTSPTDYAKEYPFVNYFKMARPWFSGTASSFSDTRSLALDVHGNVLRLEPSQQAKSVIFTGSADPGIASQTFNLMFDGDGDFQFSNVQSTERLASNHYRIRTQSFVDFSVELTVIITMVRNNEANPVRNVRLLPDGGLCASNPLVRVVSASACSLNDFKDFAQHHASIVFNPEFLEQVKKYRSLRFMDWMKTNNSPISDFASRPVVDDQFWNSDDQGWSGACPLCKGVPLEAMILLANLMDMEPWFNVPHLASLSDVMDPATGSLRKSYARQFAELLTAQLENNLTIANQKRRAFVEYSNEVWNFQFTQSVFANEMARANLAKFGTNRFGENDPGSAFVRFYADQASTLFSVFSATMGGTDRIRRVAATQAVNPYLTEEILSFRNTASSTDEFAIAPYFGDTLVDGDVNYLQCGDFRAPSASITRRDAFISAGIDGVFAWLTAAPGARDLGYGSLSCVQKVMQDQAASLAKFNLPLTSYEGGQHFLAAGNLQNDVELNALMTAVNRDPRMRQVYATYLAQFRQATTNANVSPNGNLFHHFVNSDSWSVFGRWGAKEFPTQSPTDAPKFDALMQYINDRPL